MDDPRWLRFITIGLVLAALAVGYFLISGRLTSNVAKKQQSPTPSIVGQDVQQSPVPTSPVPVVSPTPSPSPSSAYERIVNRNQVNVQRLPNTGFPVGLAVIFSISAIISGLSLRKFPN